MDLLMRLRHLLFWIALAAPLAGCTLLRPLDGLTCESGDASCSLGAACNTNADCGGTACSNGHCQCPADMVAIDSGFCIDRTEVSNAAYKKFLATKPSLSIQEPFCSFNGSFDFDTDPMVCKMRQTGDDYPATCVNWCDASAFCRSAGKHLCGKIHGGKIPDAAYKDPAQDEWFDACSRNGALVFSTGGTFDSAQCNGNKGGTIPVGVPGHEVCQGGYNGLMHMSGNAREWEDSCSTEMGHQDLCLTRGGAFDSATTSPGEDFADLRCDVHDARARDDTDWTIGFRCCSG
jgi:formylglycine-generating enzyme required for sulfatase activity